MLNSRKNRQALLLIQCFIFLSYLILSPPMYDINYKESHNTNLSEHQSTEQRPMNAEQGYLFFTTLYYGNDILTEALTSIAGLGNAAEDRQLVFGGLYILALLLAGYRVLLNYKRSFVSPTSRHIPLLAISKGGHAPPCNT